MKRPIRESDIIDSERILTNLINDYIEGAFDREPPIKKAVVVEIDTLGGQFEVDGEAPNPRNSIRARPLDEDYSEDEDRDLPVFWPLNPHSVPPIKPNELVTVLYEDGYEFSGFWICRSAEPSVIEEQKIDNKNYTPFTSRYLADPENSDLDQLTARQQIEDLEEDPGSSEIPEEFLVEDVPNFRNRVGDYVLEGSNNSLIVLGRDRPADVSSGNREAAGAVDIVVGRSSAEPENEEDLNIETDSSRISINQNTNVDINYNTTNVGDDTGPGAAIAIKSDEIRIVARNGIKVIVEGENGDLYLDSNNIILGQKKDQTEFMALGNTLLGLLEELCDILVSHTHPTAVGPSAPAIESPQFSELKTRLSTFLSESVKVKK